MDETKKDEMEQALEEGKKDEIEVAKTKEAPLSEKQWDFRIVIVLCMLAALALAIGLPVGLMRNSSKTPKEKKTSPDETFARLSLEIPDGTGKKRSLPVASFKTLKETYSSCTDLTADLKIAVRMLANQTIESNVKSFFHSPYNDDFHFASPMMEFAAIDDTGSSMVGSSAAGGGDIATEESSFGSNNQEEGVEEPDVVKSDGISVYAAYGSEIVKLNVENAQVQSRTKLPMQTNKCNLDYISSMLLVDDTLVVMGSGWCSEYEERDEGIVKPRSSIWRPESGRMVTRIVMYDKNTMDLKGDPKFIKGSYNSARSIGQDIYVVTTKSIDYWSFTEKLSIWDSSLFGKNSTESEYRQMAAEKVVDSIDEFVTQLADDLGDCSSIQRLSLFQNEVTGALPPNGGIIMESIATVTGFDVSTPELATAKSLILPQSGWQVYSSQTQLVLAAQGWWFGNGASQETYVITYSLAETEATVMGFGTVPGYILNQYSIDHQNKNGKDYLLFATTTRESWAWAFDDFEDGLWEPRTNTTSQITVLEVSEERGVKSERMEVVGKVEGLGKPGEQIYSVRFQNDRAFVVTFEQTDPFYTIDVTNPENPSKVGELEIPGFSSYLHPIGENLILGIGQYVNTDTSRQEGLQISVFDVTDFANPEQIHTFTEASGDGSGSEAEYNPMAFRYLGETGLLILPVSVYSWGRNPGDDEAPFNGFKVYKADGEGISEYLRVNHETRDYHFYRYCWRNYEGNLAARSLVFSGMLWTMQGNAIQLTDLSTRVISDEPIDLDEGMDDAVSCRPEIEFPPIGLFPTVDPFIEELDCSVVSCAIPECPDDGPSSSLEGECCPVCIPSKEPSCANVQCAVPLCAEDETPITLPGLCCPVYPPPPPPSNVEGGPDAIGDDVEPNCAVVLCERVRCADNETSFTPKGECCPMCPSGNAETGLNCSTVRCAMPECSQPTFVPDGGCCPMCPDDGLMEPEKLYTRHLNLYRQNTASAVCVTFALSMCPNRA